MPPFAPNAEALAARNAELNDLLTVARLAADEADDSVLLRARLARDRVVRLVDPLIKSLALKDLDLAQHMRAALLSWIPSSPVPRESPIGLLHWKLRSEVSRYREDGVKATTRANHVRFERALAALHDADLPADAKALAAATGLGVGQAENWFRTGKRVQNTVDSPEPEGIAEAEQFACVERSELLALLGQLPEREQIVMRGVLEGLEYVEIEAEHGWGRNIASRAYASALESLRKRVRN